jgi:hypothetical protein
MALLPIVYQKMVDDGKYEQAAALLDIAEEHNLESSSFDEIKKRIYLKLMQEYQDIDPFKFIIYASKIKQQIPEIQVNVDTLKKPNQITQ